MPDRVVKFDSVDLFIESILNEPLSIQSHFSIRFSPGDHFVHVPVNQAIKISDITDLSVTVGNPNETLGSISKVTCLANFGLSFVNVKGLQISGLHFEGCGAQTLLDLRFNEAMSIVLEANTSSDVSFDHVSITHGSGIGLLLTNVVGSLFLSNLQLVGNVINCYLEYEHIGPPECFDHSGNIFMLKYEHKIENSVISFGMSCHGALCNFSAGGLTAVFNQFHYMVKFHVNNVTFWNNTGQGNILVNSSSCSGLQLLNFTNIKSIFSDSHSDWKIFGLQYNEFQCSCKAPISRNVSISQSLFNHSCIYSELHDNLGLAAGVSYTNLNFRQTNVSHSNCTSALELHSIYSVLFDSIEISESTGPFSLRVVNRLRLVKRIYSIAFHGSCSFRNNKGGISIRGDYVRLLQSTYLKFADKSISTISGNTVLDQNGKQYGAIMYISDVVLEFLEGSCTMFTDNNGLICGGITAVRSQIWFIHNPILLFIGNIGNYGGGIALYEKSEFVFYQSNATIEFTNNSARNYGGGLYVDDSSYLERISNKYIAPYFSLYCCFPQLNFYNNSAMLGGSAMYGGWIDWVNYRYIFLIEHNISQFLHIESHEGDLSPIASRPTRVCWCSSRKPDCSVAASSQKIEIHRGGTFEIMVVATGQQSGTVASTILAKFVRDNERLSPYLKKHERFPRLGLFEKIQIVEQNCTQLKYTPASMSREETLKLTVSNRVQLRFEDKTIDELIKDPKYRLQFTDLFIHIKFKCCPFGYHVNKSIGACTCIPLPQSPLYDLYCKQQHFQLFRKESTWVGVHNHSTDMNGCLSYDRVVIFGICPFNFCKANETAINSSTLDEQCRFNRSGVLCGGCQGNLSRVFSTPYCRDCSGSEVVPTLIGYGLAGIGLIVLLLTLNLTITVGTINALIFYANIALIRGADAVCLFPTEFLHSFLYKFISLVGMGTGIEACFYDGMSTYAMSWILFLFPSYILLLSMIIITVSHYSSRASTWFGRNPVQVLATLFLLSYTSILEVTISNTAFGFTTIKSVNGQVRYVWRLDGNIPYLNKEHALLFAATMLLLLFICIPYITVLMLVQWLQRYSHKRLLRWILKLKPFIDAHMGPYKDKHRYWTGLLLLIRAGIFLFFTLNSNGNPLINAALVMFITLCLIFYLLFIRGVYKSRLLNIVEVAFLLNLCILSTSSFLKVLFKSQPYQRTSLYIAYVSAGGAFVYSCLVILYHLAVRISATSLGKCIGEIVPQVITCAIKERFRYQKLMESKVSDDLSVSQNVTHSSIAVRENDSLCHLSINS